jgi:hypothetical protein
MYFNLNMREVITGSDGLRAMFGRSHGLKLTLGDYSVIEAAPNVLLSSGYFHHDA